MPNAPKTSAPKTFLPYHFIPVTGDVNGKPVKRYRYDYHEDDAQIQTELDGERETGDEIASDIASDIAIRRTGDKIGILVYLLRNEAITFQNFFRLYI